MNSIFGTTAGLLIFVVIPILLYCLPAIAAKRRNHNNYGSILILNLFLGWTLIGWIAALIWAASDNVAYCERELKFDRVRKRY
jgi:hypothetical protein